MSEKKEIMHSLYSRINRKAWVLYMHLVMIFFCPSLKSH